MACGTATPRGAAGAARGVRRALMRYILCGVPNLPPYVVGVKARVLHTVIHRRGDGFPRFGGGFPRCPHPGSPHGRARVLARELVVGCTGTRPTRRCASCEERVWIGSAQRAFRLSRSWSTRSRPHVALVCVVEIDTSATPATVSTTPVTVTNVDAASGTAYQVVESGLAVGVTRYVDARAAFVAPVPAPGSPPPDPPPGAPPPCPSRRPCVRFLPLSLADPSRGQGQCREAARGEGIRRWGAAAAMPRGGGQPPARTWGARREAQPRSRMTRKRWPR